MYFLQDLEDELRVTILSVFQHFLARTSFEKFKTTRFVNGSYKRSFNESPRNGKGVTLFFVHKIILHNPFFVVSCRIVF